MSKIKIRRVAYALGAEITGVDLSKPLDESTVAEIRKACLDHIIVYFPGQDLTPTTLAAFGGNFGTLDDNRTTYNRDPENPYVTTVIHEPIRLDKALTLEEQRLGVVNNWHSDRSFTNRPESFAFLNAKALPDIGGDTMFANMYLAYETLSPAFQKLVESLEGVQDVSFAANFPRQSPQVQADRIRLNPLVVHPVVRVHPETGRKALYVGDRLRNFVGMTEEETKPLRDYLNEHASRYEFVYRHRWSLHDLVMWDNRCAMHYAVPDYDPRQLRRLIKCALHAPKSGYYYENGVGNRSQVLALQQSAN